MVWLATVAVVRPSDNKIVKVNADEVIFYTNQGWKRADDTGKTSGGEPKADNADEQPKAADSADEQSDEQPASEPVKDKQESNDMLAKDKPAANDNLNDVII